MGIELVGTMEVTDVVWTGDRYGHWVQWSDAPEPFFEELRRRVQRVLRERREPWVGGPSAVGTLALLVPLHLCSWYVGMVLGHWWSCAVLAYLTAMVGMKIGHPAAHGGFSAHPVLNNVGRHCFDLFNGVSWRLWDAEHTNHHENTNTSEDTDLRHQPFLRLHPTQPVLPHQRFQHLYVVPLYALVGLRWWLSSSVDALRAGITPAQKLTHVVLKVPSVLGYAVVPFVLLEGTTLVSCMLAFWITVGYTLTFNFAITHANAEVEFPTRDPAVLPWAETQVRTSSNWCAGSSFWNHVSGGMNHQIEHHLFPVMNQRLYPIIAPVVAQTCADFDIPYHDAPTFRALLVSHLTVLARLGRGIVPAPGS